jgi:very-short-patch-repair endonuclease
MNRSKHSQETRDEFCQRVAEEMRRAPTESELAMASLLLDMGVSYQDQVVVKMTPRNEIADFIVELPYATLAIEVDGQNHKKGPDSRRDKRMKFQKGIETVRIKNEDILNHRETVRERLKLAFGWAG